MNQPGRLVLRFNQQGLLKSYLGRDAMCFERSSEGPRLANAETFGKLRPRGVHENAELEDKHYISVAKKYPAPFEPFVADGVIHRSELEVTAHITAEQRIEGRSETDIDTLVRYGLASRRLQQVERQPGGRRCVQVIEMYFGDAGERYAASVVDEKSGTIVPGVGAVVALYPLTMAGRDLLRASSDAERVCLKKFTSRLRAKIAEQADPSDIEGDRDRVKQLRARLDLPTFKRMVALVRNPGSPEREADLARAKLEAEMLLAEACEAWNAVCPPVEPKKVRRGLL